MSKVYLDHLKVPVIKERLNICFAKKGPYQALKKTELLQEFADRLWDGDLKAASADLKGANAMALRFNSKNILMLIFPFDVTPGVIAHECFHMTRMICSRKGIELDDNSEEIFAHLLDFLVDEVTRLHNGLLKEEGINKSK